MSIYFFFFFNYNKYFTFIECKEFLKNSLIFVGEIGGNDFIYGFFGNNTKEKVESYVPAVINTISSVIKVN